MVFKLLSVQDVDESNPIALFETKKFKVLSLAPSSREESTTVIGEELSFIAQTLHPSPQKGLLRLFLTQQNENDYEAFTRTQQEIHDRLTYSKRTPHTKGFQMEYQDESSSRRVSVTPFVKERIDEHHLFSVIQEALNGIIPPSHRLYHKPSSNVGTNPHAILVFFPMRIQDFAKSFSSFRSLDAYRDLLFQCVQWISACQVSGVIPIGFGVNDVAFEHWPSGVNTLLEYQFGEHDRYSPKSLDIHLSVLCPQSPNTVVFSDAQNADYLFMETNHERVLDFLADNIPFVDPILFLHTRHAVRWNYHSATFSIIMHLIDYIAQYEQASPSFRSAESILELDRVPQQFLEAFTQSVQSDHPSSLLCWFQKNRPSKWERIVRYLYAFRRTSEPFVDHMHLPWVRDFEKHFHHYHHHHQTTPEYHHYHQPYAFLFQSSSIHGSSPPIFWCPADLREYIQRAIVPVPSQRLDPCLLLVSRDEDVFHRSSSIELSSRDGDRHSFGITWSLDGYPIHLSTSSSKPITIPTHRKRLLQMISSWYDQHLDNNKEFMDTWLSYAFLDQQKVLFRSSRATE